MPTAYVIALGIVVLTIGLARLVVSAVPLRRVCVLLPLADVLLVSVGVLGLVFHCGAMFFPSTVQTLPGTDTVTAEVDALGIASFAAFVVPAALLGVGLRRINPPALTLVLLSLATVGMTMYDGGPLTVHLISIFALVTVLALCAAALIGRPGVGMRGRANPSSS